MNIIWVIAKREFTANIFSLRLLIGLIVCSVLFVSTTYVLTRDYEKRLRAYNSAETAHKNELNKWKFYSELKVNVDRPPEPLGAICLGMEKQLGGTVKISYEDVPTDVKTVESGHNASVNTMIYGKSAEAPLSGGSNPLLNIFSHVDAVVIVQLVLSLFMILIAYDVISGERERGTLKLVMSNSVSRSQVLMGKYIGGMGSILLPLAIGWIAAIMLMLTSRMIEFRSAEWGRLGLLFAVSALYLSVFFLLSMLISAKARRSATALIWLLFLWVVLILVIPNGAAYLAGQIRPIESQAELDAKSKPITDEFQKKVRDYCEKHASNDYVVTDWWAYSGAWPIAWCVLNGSREAMLWYLDGARFYVPLRIEYAERVGNIHKEHYRSLKKQTVLAGNLSRLSPGWVYYNTSAILTGTGLGRYEQFISRAQDYRRELMEYMRGQGAFTTIKYFSNVNLDELPSQVEGAAKMARIREEYNLIDTGRRYDSLSQAEKERRREGVLALMKAEQANKAIMDGVKPESWDEVPPLDLSGMPIFTFGKESFIAVIGQALPDLAILLLLNVLLFWGAAVSFLKGEVK